MLVRPRAHVAPKVLPARQRLHPTHKEIRHAFDFACGELPDTEDAELLDLGKPGDFISELNLPEQSIDAVEVAAGPIALTELPQYTGNTTNIPPLGGIPPVFGPVFNPAGASPIIPTLPTLPSTPGTPSTPQSPVPEPGTIALVLTGLVGVAGTARRRFR